MWHSLIIAWSTLVFRLLKIIGAIFFLKINNLILDNPNLVDGILVLIREKKIKYLGYLLVFRSIFKMANFWPSKRVVSDID